MESRIINEPEMDVRHDAGIREGLCICFPADREIFSRTRTWHGTLPTWSVLLKDGDVVAAHAGIVERTIRAGSEEVHVAGVQNVFVLPEYRKEGLFKDVMIVTMEEADRRGLECGFLFCTPQIGKFYKWLKWRLLDVKAITRIDADGEEKPIPGKNVAMFYPLRRKSFPVGDIHLQGNDW